MYAKYLSGSALATLIIVPIAGIAAYQVMQREAAPTYIKLPVGKDNGGAAITTDQVPLENFTRSSKTPLPLEAGKAVSADELKRRESGQEGAHTAAPVPEAAPAKPVPALLEKAKQDQGLFDDKRIDGTIAQSEAEPAADMAAASPAPSGVMLARKKEAGRTEADAEYRQQPIDQTIVEENRDKFPEFKSNSTVLTATQPVSTFSVDVDTSGYSALRRALNQGVLPDHEQVRVEEMVNYFPYSYAGPDNATDAFKANVTVTPTPWNKNTKLLHVGIKGYDVPADAQKPVNLVFLIDVSGSMDEPDKLPLLKSSFRLLVNKLKPSDTVAIAVYAGNVESCLSRPRLRKKRRFSPPSTISSPAARRRARRGSTRLMPWRSRLSSKTASTGSCWRRTATSTSARRMTRP